MATAAAPEPVDLVAKRAEVTRDAIRAALAAVLEEEHPAAISVPAVAARAGVSVRTVYRYFESKQALLDDFADGRLRRVALMNQRPVEIFENPEKWLPVVWANFAEDLPAIRAQHASAAGADLRDRRLAASRQGMREQIRKSTPNAAPAEVELLADAIIVMTSSGAFLELHERLGYGPEDAAALALWAARAMQKQFVEEGFPPDFAQAGTS